MEHKQEELLPMGSKLWEQQSFQPYYEKLRGLHKIINRANDEQLYGIMWRVAEKYVELQALLKTDISPATSVELQAELDKGVSPETADIAHNDLELRISGIYRSMRKSITSCVTGLKSEEERGKELQLYQQIGDLLLGFFKQEPALPQYIYNYHKPNHGIVNQPTPRLDDYLKSQAARADNARWDGLTEHLATMGFANAETLKLIGLGMSPVGRTYAQRRAAETTKPK